MKMWLGQEGVDMTDQWAYTRVLCFCFKHLPAPKQILPKMIALLQLFHESGQNSSGFYFGLQKSIQNHYRTEGNCLFFEDAKEIHDGDPDYAEKLDDSFQKIVNNVSL
jgi:hypothetical protein